MNEQLLERSQNLCELCSVNQPAVAYTVSPKSDDDIQNQVAICPTCEENINNNNNSEYWRCLEGAIWNPEPSVQALSYRILLGLKDAPWASDTMESVELDDNIKHWGNSVYEVAEVHKDAFGNVLNMGDTVVLTQNLNVKGTNFTAPKGTVVKRIKLVHDNVEQIEGKINEQVIVILTKYVKLNN